jgi:hypothetical protein
MLTALATSRSTPIVVSKTQSEVTGLSPAGERRKTTRSPSGETVKLRGVPRENRRVRASWRGKETAGAPICGRLYNNSG